MTPFPWPDFPLGIGTGRLCSLNGGLSVARAAKLLQRAYDLGIRFVDTAPSYGQGQAEEAIGALPTAVRDDLLICTKIGYSAGKKGPLINAAKPFVRPILPWASALRRHIASARDQAGTTGSMTVEIDREAIEAAITGSLQRLRREQIDLYMLHDPSLQSVQQPENHDAFSELMQSGKIRCAGISTNDPAVAVAAAAVELFRVIEIPGFPAWAVANQEVFDTCAEHGVEIIANGVLTPLTGEAHGGGEVGKSLTAKECIEYSLGLPQVKMALFGARKHKHLDANVAIARELVTKQNV